MECIFWNYERPAGGNDQLRRFTLMRLCAYIDSRFRSSLRGGENGDRYGICFVVPQPFAKYYDHSKQDFSRAEKVSIPNW